MTSPLLQALRDVRAEAKQASEVEEVRADVAAGGLRRFVQQAWPWLEPGVRFVPNWHIDAICEHLEAAYRREIKRLLINVPPRTMKSRLVSVLGPAYRWTTRPHERFLTASYAHDLAGDLARDTRQLILTPWYQHHWGAVFKLAGDQNQKHRYANDLGGYRIATSVGSGRSTITGLGGDILILDDPNAAGDAYSEAARERVIRWHGNTWASRINDPATGVRIVIQQRVHERDLTGHLLEQSDAWTHLCLPMEYDRAHPFLWPQDPREVNGELLWPTRFDQVFVEEQKLEMGSYGAAGQLQQLPAPAEGGILKRAWWRFYDRNTFPTATSTLISCDPAWRDKQSSDYVVAQLWAVNGPNRYLIRSVRGQWDVPAATLEILQLDAFAEVQYPRLGRVILVEPTAAGPDIIAALRRKIPAVIAPPVKGDKIMRAHAVSPQLEAGNVFVPGRQLPDGSGPDPEVTPAWVQSLIEECASFPAGAYDDQVDALTQALKRASVTGGAAPERRQRKRGREAGVRSQLGYGSHL